MKKWICAVLLAAVCFLSGCDRNEIESRAFPLAMGIDVDEDQQFQMYMAYPDLQDKDAKENALAKDVFWNAAMAELIPGVQLLSQGSNRNVDMNHLKVLILDQKLLESEETTKQLIEFLRDKKNAAWNTYVMLADGKLPELFSDEEKVNTCLGMYLEDMLEGWTNLKSGGLITVGDLMSQYYNQREDLLIPIVTVEDGSPIVYQFCVVRNLKCVSQMSLEEVFAQFDSLKQNLSE